MSESNLPYPLKLCVELLAYAGVSCPLTQNMTASEIKKAAAVFFDEATITEATKILCGQAVQRDNAPELATWTAAHVYDKPTTVKMTDGTVAGLQQSDLE